MKNFGRSSSLRGMNRLMNPVPNVEKSPGAGGHLGMAQPTKHVPHAYPTERSKPIATVVHIALPKMNMQGATPMQGGGPVDEPDSTDEPMPDAMDLREDDDQLSPRDQKMKEIVVEAMAALRGQHPDPQKAIQRFVDAFGADELEELKQMMGQEGGPDEQDMDEDDTGGAMAQAAANHGQPPPPPGSAPAGMQVGGLLNGPGGGQDDQIEAATPAGRKVLLSDGEYVVDAPTVAALGDGSTNAGARRLDQLRKAVRQQAYGHSGQAKQMSAGGRAALLEALNR